MSAMKISAKGAKVGRKETLAARPVPAARACIAVRQALSR